MKWHRSTDHGGQEMPAIRSSIWLATVVAALAAGAAVAWLAMAPPPTPPEVTSAPVLSLEKLGHLLSLKINYSDVVEFDAKRTQDIPFTQWELRFGGTKVLLVARGECTIGTDLAKAKFEVVSSEKKTLKLVLPAQPVITARVNHEPREKGGSYFYAISTHGLEPFIPDSSNREKATNSVLTSAEGKLKAFCSEAKMVNEARRNAEQVLAAALAATGWTPTFEWR